MSGGLGKFREDIIALLRQENIPAIAAFEPEERKWLEEPTAVVSLARVTCTPGGFQNYLGTRTGADGQNEEWYGREAQLTVALDLYAPRTGGESACRQTMERMAEVLLSRGARRWQWWPPWRMRTGVSAIPGTAMPRRRQTAVRGKR